MQGGGGREQPARAPAKRGSTASASRCARPTRCKRQQQVNARRRRTRAAGEGPREAGIDGRCESLREADALQEAAAGKCKEAEDASSRRGPPRSGDRRQVRVVARGRRAARGRAAKCKEAED